MEIIDIIRDHPRFDYPVGDNFSLAVKGVQEYYNGLISTDLFCRIRENEYK